MANNTLTLQQVINVCSTHIDLYPLQNVGGYVNEPALSLCNDALSDLLTAPFDWKFNRVEMNTLITAMNKQDYLFAGASAFTLGASSTGAAVGLASNLAITETSTTVTVTTLEPHRFVIGQTVFMTGNTVADYNSTFTDNGTTTGWTGGWVITAVPTSKAFTFTHAQSGLANSGAAGINDFGWLACASMVELNNTSSPSNIRQLQAVRELPVWNHVANPTKVSVLVDYGDGTLKLRFYDVPGSAIWCVNLVYQAKPPLKTSLADLWTPFPDHYSAVYRQALMYRTYRYINSSKADVEYQKLQQQIMKALGASDREDSDMSVVPAEAFLDWNWGI